MAQKARCFDDDAFDLTALLHPAQAFATPMDVVNDLDLTVSEKRAILAAWASDACAVEAVPELRRLPGQRPVRFDDVMEALRELDRRSAESGKPLPHYRRVLANRSAPAPARRPPRRGSGNEGTPLQ
jgi:hypothetical protein